MCYRCFLIAFCLFNFAISAYGQVGKTPSDVTLIIHESVINKLFKVIGQVSGTNPYRVGFIEGTYSWIMQPARVELIKDSARFVAEVKVKAGPVSYTTEVPGKVAVKYLEKSNQIQLTVVDAVFEIYTKLLGKKVHIKDIQLAEYFKEPFLFNGPANMETDMDLTMPDGTIKKIFTKTENCKLKIEAHQIVLNSQLVFYEKIVKP